MIKNERQYNITRSRIRRLELLREELASKATAPDENARHRLELRAVEAEIRRMVSEVAEYDALRAGNAPVTVRSLEELPQALIRARIAAGLTHQELAERLGLKEQQVQRYEATDYESASFERLMEVARAVGLEVTAPPLTELPPWKQVERTLSSLGIDRKFLARRFSPPERAEDRRMLGTISRVAHVYGVSPESVLDGSARFDEFEFAAAAYKTPKRASRAALVALSGYARFLSRIAAQGAPAVDLTLPATAEQFRLDVLSVSPQVSFDVVLRALWDRGIMVLPLLETGGFHAGYWRHGPVVVVVLNPAQRYTARWLFDLLHELGHIVEDDGTSMIEFDPGVSDAASADSEREANEFALRVIFGDAAGALFDEVLDRSGGEQAMLQRTVSMVARQHGIDPGALAFNVAYQLQQQGVSWWGAANTLAKSGVDPWRLARDEFISRTRWDVLAPLDRELLRAALDDPTAKGLEERS